MPPRALAAFVRLLFCFGGVFLAFVFLFYALSSSRTVFLLRGQGFELEEKSVVAQVHFGLSGALSGHRELTFTLPTLSHSHQSLLFPGSFQFLGLVL